MKTLQQATVLLTTKEAADFLGLAEQTLCNWRHAGKKDPAYVKRGKYVRYRLEDLEAFIARHFQGEAANG